MCGIAGLLNFDRQQSASPDLLRAMVAAIRHRGPDDDGYYCAGPVALGMRRLSILDIATSRQPLYNEDRTVVLVYNGEIYNYRELRSQLQARGHRLATNGDGETILHLYEEQGPGLLEQLQGMFAFALWDEKRQRLLLARDRMGIKPLYYARAGGRLLFGSELKCLLCDRDLGLRLDPRALHDYLTFLYVPQPKTIFRDVHKLPPASYLLAEDGELSLHRYWRLDPALNRAYSEEQWLEVLQQRWQEVIASHLQSDVPVGVFLSGGVDSSLIVSAASALGTVRTFTVGFDEPEFDETSFARQVAERFGTDHTEITLQPAGIELVDRIIGATDEPFADASALPTFLVCQAAARHVKVALSGAGGDELFGGYWMYVFDRLAQRLDLLPRPVMAHLRWLVGCLPGGSANSIVNKGRRALKDFSRPAVIRHLGRLTVTNFDEADKAALYSPAFRSQVAPYDSYLAMQQQYGTRTFEDLFIGDTTTYLVDDLLAKVDRMSMANSLEVRVPFLDHGFAELALSIPAEFKLRGFRAKHILKRLAARTIPPGTIYRKKRGFSVPLAAWFRGPLATHAHDAFSRSLLVSHGIVEPAALDDLLSQHHRGQRDNGLRIWQLLVLEHWLRAQPRSVTL